jgi:hypothetical protein
MVVGLPMGWTVTNWADLATAIPGAENHPLYPAVVAYTAYAAWIRNDRDRAQHLVTVAQAAQRSLGTDHFWVEQAAGIVAFFQSDLDIAVAHAESWLTGARERNDTYEVVRALSLLAVALSQSDIPRARAAADEAIRLAREHGIHSALLWALLVRPILPIDAEEALALLDEATALAMTLGDQYALARADGMRGVIAARAGEWGIALQSFVRIATYEFAVGENWMLPEAPRGAAVALAHLGDLEDAAVILSFAETNFVPIAVGPDPTRGTYLMDETRDLLREGLSETELAQLTARGASLSTRNAITIMRDAAESHRRDQPTSQGPIDSRPAVP